MNAVTETKAQHANVFCALAAAQGEFSAPRKDSTNPAFRSRYADLANVVEAVAPALSRHGIAFAHYVEARDLGEGPTACMITALIHGASETRMECPVPLIIGKRDMQGFKSAATYAKRIGLESVTGVAPDDDDGNAAAAAAPRQQDRQQAPRHRPDPSHDKPSPADHAITALGNAGTIEALAAIWGDMPAGLKALPEVMGAKDNRKAELAKPAPANADLGGDEVPY